MREYRAKNYERQLAYQRELYRKSKNKWRRENKEKVQARRNHLYMTDQEHRQRVIKSAASSYQRNRSKLIAGYGGMCACCGETEPNFLELDHVNGGGSKHFKVRKPDSVYRDAVRAGFPPEYQLLCSNCNRGRQRNGGICPHQTAVKAALRIA